MPAGSTASLGLVYPGLGGQLRCTGSYAVSVRSSIVLSVDQDANGWTCPGAQVSHTAAESMVSGNDNVLLCDSALDCTMDIVPQLFMSATNLRLNSSGADILAGIPLLAPGDPPFDIDLDPRPSASGIDYAGAHVPP
jgi:hypothetical protein